MAMFLSTVNQGVPDPLLRQHSESEVCQLLTSSVGKAAFLHDILQKPCLKKSHIAFGLEAKLRIYLRNSN